VYGLKGLSLRLFNDMERMRVIDAHEHLDPESVSLTRRADVFTLFSHYVRMCGLRAAGMPPDVWPFTAT